MTIYFTADTHYFHNNIIGYCNRPYNNINEMNADYIKKYNSVVKPEDTCIFVGDFIFTATVDKGEEVLKQLNGTKILICGNHDLNPTKMYRMGFNFVCYELRLNLGGEIVRVKHYPFRKPWYKYLFKRKPKYYARMPKNDGLFLISGHTHSKIKVEKNQINVGVDAWGGYPVSQIEIVRIIQQYQKNKKNAR